MGQYIAKRLVQSVIVLIGITAVVFFALNLTGDPLSFMLPVDAPQEVFEQYREMMGLDDPIIVQYIRFLANAVKGDFGTSHFYKQPAMAVVLERLPQTALLAFVSLLLAVIIAIPTGIIAAVKRNTLTDSIVRLLAMLGQCLPTFWLGLLLMLLFSVKLNWLPTYGTGTVLHIIMPSVTLAVHTAANMIRLLRSGMLDVLGQEYIMVARSKGVRDFPLVMKHAFKNSLSSVLTILGLQLAQLMSGALVVENVFSWPGVGRLMYNSILNRDFMVVEAGVCMIASFFVIVNLTVDILYAAINPRVKYE